MAINRASTINPEYEILEVTVTAGQTVSTAAVFPNGGVVYGIFVPAMPAAVTATFQGTLDGSVFSDVYAADGVQSIMNLDTAARLVIFRNGDFKGMGDGFKIELNATEVADKVFKLLVRPE